jgi:glycosyltransferase involved in cell wall biosynthesis
MLLNQLLKKAIGGKPPRKTISVIICSIDDRRFNAVAENYAQRMGDWPHEMIHIRNAPSLAAGYNRGIKRSTGEFLIFSHDDIEILTPDFRERLLDHLDSFDLVGVAGTSALLNGHWQTAGQPRIHGQVVQPANNGSGFTLNVFGPVEGQARGGIVALDGLFFATWRKVVESLRFDAELFDGFHLYDLDFSYRAHLAGLRVGVCNDILIYHQSLGRADETWKHYSKVFVDKFAGDLLDDPPGLKAVYVQQNVRTKVDALSLFQQYLRGECAVTEPAPRFS